MVGIRKFGAKLTKFAKWEANAYFMGFRKKKLKPLVSIGCPFAIL